MKKILLVSILLFSFLPFVKAEDNSKFFIQAGAGAGFALDKVGAPDERFESFFGFDFIAGVNLFDAFGVRVGYQGQPATLIDEDFYYSFIHMDLVWNVTDMKCIQAKHFILKPYVHAGYAISEGNSFGAGVGGVIGLRVSKHFDLVLDGRTAHVFDGSVYPDGGDKTSNSSLTFNIVYNF